jgi:hypothetical protein
VEFSREREREREREERERESERDPWPWRWRASSIVGIAPHRPSSHPIILSRSGVSIIRSRRYHRYYHLARVRVRVHLAPNSLHCVLRHPVSTSLPFDDIIGMMEFIQ